MTGDNNNESMNVNKNDKNKKADVDKTKTDGLTVAAKTESNTENSTDDKATSLKQNPSTATETATVKPKAPSNSIIEKKPNKKQTSSFFILILLLLLLTGLAVGGYFAWQFWNQYSSAQEQRIKALENAATLQGSQVQTLASAQTENTEGQNEIVNTIQASQEAIQQRLDSHTQRIRALAGTSRNDWLLAEARYLLRLANQRLLVERGTDGARALLESADNILRSVDDSAVMAVRSAIANEVIALKLAQTVDRQGLYLELSAIKQQIQALPLIPFRPNAAETETSATSIQEPRLETPWYDSVWGSIKNAFGNLGRFVQIRSHDQAPELLVTQTQQLQTINHLMLMFEQAQFALLHEEEMIYRNSLEEAVKWWDNYYSHYNEHEILRAEIKNLQKTTIVQVLPDISRSSELLTDYIERFHKLNNATPAGATKASPLPAPTPKDNTNIERNGNAKISIEPIPTTPPVTIEATTQEPQS